MFFQTTRAQSARTHLEQSYSQAISMEGFGQLLVDPALGHYNARMVARKGSLTKAAGFAQVLPSQPNIFSNEFLKVWDILKCAPLACGDDKASIEPFSDNALWQWYGGGALTWQPPFVDNLNVFIKFVGGIARAAASDHLHSDSLREVTSAIVQSKPLDSLKGHVCVAFKNMSDATKEAGAHWA